MIGSILMNEIFNSHTVKSPSEILDRLNYLLQISLEKDGKIAIKDGMDISLCSINLLPFKEQNNNNNTNISLHDDQFNIEAVKTNNFELQWAGANNSLYIIKKDSNELIQVKADKQPIGFNDNIKPFTNHTIQLSSGDSIILYSDGIVDQFGGPKGKKFKHSQFKNILLSMVNEPMKIQGEFLQSSFETWKGDLEQVDDVCIIGVRI